MGSYKLLIKRSAEKDFKPLPKKDRHRVIMKIRQLVLDPRPEGAEKLKGSEYWRIRQGGYRIIYGIDESSQTITIERVGHRLKCPCRIGEDFCRNAMLLKTAT